MTVTVDDTARTRRITFIVLGVIFTILLIVALARVPQRRRARSPVAGKADQLSDAFTEAGLPAPDRDQIVRTLGDDGGAVCADPDAALKRAVAQRTAGQRRGRTRAAAGASPTTRRCRASR